MTLFNIAVKNIKRNFYNYFLYFVSMIFSIIIYYTFTSIQYNSEVIKALTGTGFTVTAMSSSLKASSITIALFSAIFIWYSSSFFTRRRKKEIGLYSMMGVKKKQIGRMLFYENIAMGILALLIGIFIGSLLSKLFIMLLLKLMGFVVQVKFAIIPKAIIDTAITFAVIFLISSIHSYTIIYRFKLVELFNAERSGEREPKASVILAILSILFIGSGYYVYLRGFKITNNFVVIVLSTLILTVSGTYLLFSSLVVFIIKLSKLNRKRYYKGINMIGTSQLLYRIKSHSRTLATIAVLSASTLTALAVISSIYYDLTLTVKNDYPFTYSYISNERSIDKDFCDIISKYPENKILNQVEAEVIRLDGKYPYQEEKGTIFIVSESKYNEIAKLTGRESVILNNLNDSVLFDKWFREKFNGSYAGKDAVIYMGSNEKKLRITKHIAGSFFNRQMFINNILVVKDNIYDEAYNAGAIFRINSYITDNKNDSEKLDIKLNEFMKGKEVNFSSYYTMYIEQLRLNGLVIFIGSFLGLVFLSATGSIIFFKQLSEANDDKQRYRILRNIGVSKKEIRGSISKQMLFVFLLPLVVGAIHSIVAITLLSQMVGRNFTVPVFVTIGLYTLIYFVYYILTINSYSKIVNANV